MTYVRTTGNAREQNLLMFVIMVYVYAIQDTYKMTGSATKVKHFNLMMMSIILQKKNQHTSIQIHIVHRHNVLIFFIHKLSLFIFQLLFPSVGFVNYTNNALEVIILEYVKTKDVPVQKDSQSLIRRVKKVMLS